MASSGVSTSSWSKWQIALVIGAPVAFGIGYWYLKQNVSSTDENKGSSSSCKSKLSSLLGTGTQTSIDTDGLESVNSSKTLPENPLERALYHKDAGNQHFKAGKYDEAIKCYNEAISVCPTDKRTDLATFYQNRAAAYEQLKLYKEVREDCTRALELNPKYVKALQRRAKACELTNDLQQSLEDVTSACILEGFQNQSNLLSADRVLKELGRQEARVAMANRKPMMPSKQFVKTFFSSFSEDPINSMNGKNESDSAEADIRGYARAKQAFFAQDYDDIIPACTDEINSESSEYKNEALVLRGTFHLLVGMHDEAFKDFDAVIYNANANVKLRVNALIKRASLFMQLEQNSRCMEDFNMAAQLDPMNSDVFHHRGQVHLLLEKMHEAVDDFNRAVSLNPNFPIAYVQKCYTDYRHAYHIRNMERVEEVMNEFRRAVERFPTCSESHTLFAQVLSDQQDYERADQYYQKAIEIEPENATLFVHRGLLQLQSKGDIAKAIELISKAIKIDDKCEFAYETLGTIEVQRGNLKRAVELFDKAIPLAKTEIEMSHLFSLRDAAIAQAKVAERMGINVALSNQI